MAFQFGHYVFPMAPTSYNLPGVKSIDVAYAVNGTMLLCATPENENEFSLSWENVINDMNGIVLYLKNFINQEINGNNKRHYFYRSSINAPKYFNDGIGFFQGYASLTGASMSVTKKGGHAFAYNITLNFKLR